MLCADRFATNHQENWESVAVQERSFLKENIRMLEAMKNMEKIQLDAMDRKIGELRRTVKG
jgi:hypothetical protein